MVANKEIERIEHSAVKLTVTVPQQEVKNEYDNLLTNYSRQIQIKGFRKGKVPPAVLERKFGEGIREEASRNLMEKSLKELFEEIEEKPLPYSVPELQDDSSLELDKDFTFTVKYDVFPEIEVGEYKGLQIEGIQVKIGKEDEKRELAGIQEQNSVVMDKESGSIDKDNIVTVDYVELGEGDEPIEETRRQDFVFTVGTGYNIYKIDDDIIGMQKGQEKVIEKSYPEDYEIKEIAGSTRRIQVKITNVKEKQLPEINDELAQDVSEKYESLADLKKDIRNRLEETAQSTIKERNVNLLLQKVAEGSKVDVPRSMIDMELEQTWRNFVSRFRTEEDQVLRLLAAQGKSREDLYEEWRPDVEKNVKIRLVVRKLIELENVEASDEDLQKEIEIQAERNNMSVQELSDYFERNQMKEYLKHELQERKLYDMLLEQAKVKKGKEVAFLDLQQGNV